MCSLFSSNIGSCHFFARHECWVHILSRKRPWKLWLVHCSYLVQLLYHKSCNLFILIPAFRYLENQVQFLLFHAMLKFLLLRWENSILTNYLCNCICFSILFLGKYTPQNQWLEEELPKVNRRETPWLIVLMHSPWYNSYDYHYMEGETMRVMYESWFVKYKVDVVFAGHVHAYERSVSVPYPS